jgi:hypothetical protein
VLVVTVGWLVAAFIAGIVTEIIFRAKISKYVKTALSWFRKTADDVEKNL